MEKCYNSFKSLTEQEEYTITSNYMDFIYKYNEKLQGLDANTIVNCYLKLHGKGEEIDRILEDMNNIIDLREFSKKYNRKLLILKAGIREGYIKEIYLNLAKYKHLHDVYRIKKFLEINGFNQDNLPDEWIERICNKIENAIEEKRNNL